MLMLVGTAAFAGPTTTADAKKVRVATKTVKKAPVQKVVDDHRLPSILREKTDNLNPVLLKRFDRYRTFIYQNYGVTLEITSGYRSTEEQAYLFRTLPRGRANPPGVSLHEKGEAIDYRPYTQTYNQHLPAFGLKAPYPGIEDWHVERSDN